MTLACICHVAFAGPLAAHLSLAVVVVIVVAVVLRVSSRSQSSYGKSSRRRYRTVYVAARCGLSFRVVFKKKKLKKIKKKFKKKGRRRTKLVCTRSHSSQHHGHGKPGRYGAV